jgi:hypothetical protein
MDTNINSAWVVKPIRVLSAGMSLRLIGQGVKCWNEFEADWPGC